MRRMVMMLGAAMIILVVTAGVALAVTKTCKDVPCRGTDNDDVLYERIGQGDRDRIYGLKGNDDISAALYSDDKDRLFGGRHGDRIVTSDRDGRDLAAGGSGRDKCTVTQGDITRSCENVDVVSASDVPQGGVLPQGFGDPSTNPQDSVDPE